MRTTKGSTSVKNPRDFLGSITTEMGRFAVRAVVRVLLCGFLCGMAQELNADDLVTANTVTGEECQDVILTCRLRGEGRSLGLHRRFSWSKQGGDRCGDGGGTVSITDCSFREAGQLLDPSDKFNYAVAKDNTSCNLTVRGLQLSDAGCYQCDSWAPSGAVSSCVELVVVDPVRRASIMQTSPVILEGIPATFTCSAGYGDDEVQFTWQLDGTDRLPNEAALVRPTDGSVDCTGRNETLSTVELTLKRNGSGSVLQCEVRGAQLLETASLIIPDVQVPPTSVAISNDITRELRNVPGGEVLIKEHGNASFSCVAVDTKPAAHLTWLYRGLEVQDGPGGLVETVVERPGVEGSTYDVSSTVILRNIPRQDDGAELVCNATGAGGVSATLGIKITVNAPPQNVTITTGVIVESVPAQFACSAEGSRTRSSIVWYLDGVTVAATGSQQTSFSPELLKTTSVVTLSLRRHQSGSRLRCEASHELLDEPLIKEVVLDVYFCPAPSITCPTSVNNSDPYTLTCRTASSRPPANLSMYFEEPLQLLGAETETEYEPADDEGATAVLTVELTGDRSDHGKMVVCRRSPSEICRNEELDTCHLNMHFPPTEVELLDGANSDSDSHQTGRSVEVIDGREYAFTCSASGSNPPATFQWKLGDAELHGAAYTETERRGPGPGPVSRGWDASSRLSLTVRQDVSQTQMLTCRVMYPSQRVFRQLSLELSIIAVTLSWSSITAIVACSCAVVIVVVACLVLILYKMRHHGNRPINLKTDMEMLHIDSIKFKKGGSNTSLSSGGTAKGSLEGSEAYEFPRDKLKLLEVVGNGSFGLVYKATAEGIFEKGVVSTVAVKTPNPSGSPADREAFVKELEMFTILVQHPNVVSMLGYCRKKNPLYLIMEYVSNGNLENYLRQEKQRVDQSYINVNGVTETIGPNQILTFAIQIVRGMKYLESVQCIHRDLATRNILLDEQMVCKVSDFGLARHVPAQKQYEMKSKGRVPFRWMAPESIVYNVYSSKSDVWSFGVLLWELVTLGSHPYPGLSCAEILEDLQRGIRLKKPTHCSDEIYQVMKDCWEHRPEKRPDFEMLHQRIEAMLANASGYLLMSNFSAEQYLYMAPSSKGNL
ncbi:uncharacterized protein LOC119720942 [Patiria miniata]|uniref:receptor protein-tyrosine kinase n=1 Tax=Patiria miniata TaxID=46514 RepID=A0A913Z7D1_PATMI|nr:uncharacterized protein LOC119720942 [Patiria miniata]